MRFLNFLLGSIFIAGGLILSTMPKVFALDTPATVQSPNNQGEINALIKDIKHDKRKLADEKSNLEMIEDQLKADVKVLKEAEAAHSPTLIKAAKQKLKNDRKLENKIRNRLSHLHHNLTKDVRDYRHDRRQIKHGI